MTEFKWCGESFF